MKKLFLTTIALCFIIPSFAKADITSNLLLHYTLDDNAANTTVLDAQSLSNGTASTNTSNLHVAGTIGTGAFQFATSSAQTANTNYVWSATDSSWTISVWVKYTFIAASEAFVNSSHGQRGLIALQGSNSNRAQCSIFDTGTQSLTITATTTNIGNNAWHLITCVLNGTGGHVYVDGVERGTGSNASLNGNYKDNTNGTLHLAWNNSAANYTGTLDDVCIYNRALSTADVVQLFQSTTGCTAASATPSPFLKFLVSVGSAFGILSGSVFQAQ